jgi:hypothetical protein
MALELFHRAAELAFGRRGNARRHVIAGASVYTEIAHEARGLVIYEHQEGRGIGLIAKLQAYGLQDAGLDTVEANRALGFPVDCRDFSLPTAILHELGIRRVRLLSAGGKDNGAPGYRDYSPGYYAAFVYDPDGNNIEAVWYDPSKEK